MSPIRILSIVFVAALVVAIPSFAQYSEDVFKLKKAQELYDERGFTQGKAITVDGKLVVSESNGNVSYSYPISSYTRNGHMVQTSLNYCGSVGVTAFRQYHLAHDAPTGDPVTPYAGWEKFHQNRPMWLISVNNFAVQAIATSTHFTPGPTSKVFTADPDTIKEKDLVWAIDGYDFSNRMTDFGAYGAGEVIGNTYTDNIRLLRGDGSVLELVRATQKNETPVDQRPEVYTGYYVPMEANGRAYALVEFDSTYWMPYITGRLTMWNSQKNPVTPRVVRYFPGDGLEYRFREWIVPFGSLPYFDTETKYGGKYAGPTVFYLEEIRTTGATLVHFNRSRHYPVAPYGAGWALDDSSRGRALLVGFEDHRFEYGSNAMTIEALGRTTKVKFGKVIPSGAVSADTASMPIDENGYFWTMSIFNMARHDSMPDVHRSWAGYVTEIVDPEGRATTFAYEPYERRYVSFGFPRSTTATVTLRNLRLREVTEPAARYTIAYFKKASDISYVPGTNDALYLTTSGLGDTLSVYNDNTLYDAAKLTNAAGLVKKFDRSGNPLVTDRYWFEYVNNASFADRGYHRLRDEVTGDQTETDQYFRRYSLPTLAPKLPPPVYTSNYRTVTRAVDTVVTETYSSASTSLASMTLWGTNYSVATTPYGTPFLILDTARKTQVNGILKSHESFSATVDTFRQFGTDTKLRQLFGLDLASKTTTVRNPATGGTITATTTEYLHLPEFDTVGTEVYSFMRKLEMIRLWDSLRAADPAMRHVPWERAMYDPRILRLNYDTVYRRHFIPPLFGLERRIITRNASGAVLAGRATAFRTTHDSTAFLSYVKRGARLADTAIGAGGVAYRAAAYDYDYGTSSPLPTGIRNANGAVAEQTFDPFYRFAGQSSPQAAYGGALDNLDSVRLRKLEGAAYANANEEPMATRKRVRRYTAGGGGAVDTLTLSEHVERSYYGQVGATRDANGWYTRAAHDANGRLRMLWHAGDFQSTDSIHRVNVTGVDSTQGYGVTADTLWHDWKICDAAHQPLTPTTPEPRLNWGALFAARPAVEVPDCPPCNEAEEKRPGHRPQAPCYNPIAYTWATPAIGSATFEVLPYQTESIVSLDSAWLRLYVTGYWGSCVSLKVTVPALGVTRTYLFGCTQGGGGGGNGSGARGRGGATPLSGGTGGGGYLYVNLTPVKSQLLTYAPGQTITAIFEVTTTGGRVALAGGYDGADTRPQLFLKGTLRKTNHLADYTLAYSYNDTTLTATVRAKVDDSLHSANRGAWNPLADIARRATLRHTAGADGRLLRTEGDIREHWGALRTDTSTFAYTGLGRRMQAKDPEGDSVRTRYDAQGRAVEGINADSTIARTAYRVGAPAGFGLSGQEFYGFATMTTTTNENGVRFTRYTDAFDGLRREVADTGGLRLVTMYDYDTLGRLSQVVNPKGDITRYWYDPFGRVQAKSQPDLGAISYAYDRQGNVRFTQTQEQANKDRLTFNQYDDLNRLTLIGEAVIGEASYNEDTVVSTPTSTGGGGSGNPALTRLTSALDPDRLHTGAVASLLTANRTLWMAPAVPSPQIPPGTDILPCVLSAEPRLGETTPPVGPFIRRPAMYWNAPVAPADTNSFENIALHPDFVRIAVAYDTLPSAQGAVWAAFPAHAGWAALMPKGAVRNQMGRESAVAWRERGSEPFHYAVMSYDERGRVEALVRYTENIGFDAVYYTYNSLNQATSVTSADLMRQHTSWYGYDANGRVDSVWTKLSALGGGLSTLAGIRFPGRQSRPDTADIVYRYTRTGQVDTMLYVGPGVTVTYDYNKRKWLDSLVASKSGGNVFREVLAYDPTGQIVSQIWQHGTSAKQKQRYFYDSTQRLVEWHQGKAFNPPTVDSTAYAYDRSGNRLSRDHGANQTEWYTYTGGTNRLAIHRAAPPLTNAVERYYEYNANGSTVIREKYEAQGGGWVWKDREELGQSFRELVKRYKHEWPGALGGTTNTEDWRYRYSAGGEREQKRLYPYQYGDTDMVYPWVYYLLGGKKEQLAVYHGQGSLNVICADSVRRVWMYPWEYRTFGIAYIGVMEDIGQVVTYPNGAKEYRLADHLASTRVTIDASGTASSYDYDPWGNLAASPGGDPLTRGFNNREQDRESGQFNLGVRQYEPDDGGRFLSIDPLWERFRGSSPYVYANNNPVSMTDPDGMQSKALQPAFSTIDALSSGVQAIGGAASAYILAKYLEEWLNSEEYIDRSQPLVATESGDLIFNYPNGLTVGVPSVIAEEFGIGIAIPILMLDAGESGPDEPPMAVPGTGSSVDERNAAQDKILTEWEIKKLEQAGYDVHKLKGKTSTGQIDLYKDKKGNVYIKPKGGIGPGEPLDDININDL